MGFETVERALVFADPSGVVRSWNAAAGTLRPRRRGRDRPDAQNRQHELRVDAARARLASATRQARRRRSRIDRLLRVAPLWRRTPTETSKPAAVAPTARSIQFDHLASDGPAANHDELTRFVEHAAARGATPLLLSILADDNQPDVVRQRAFGRIAAELASAVSGTAHPVPGWFDAA